MQSRFTSVRTLANERATIESVSENLKSVALAHFACHAFTHLERPTQSGLMLYDGVLTSAEVSRLDLAQAELAVLPGCETTRVSMLTPSESINVSSAFLLAGFPHVVGCLWPLVDDVSYDLMRTFYASLAERRENLDPAGAMHVALHSARQKYPGMPILWAGMMHVGPSSDMKDSVTARILINA